MIANSRPALAQKSIVSYAFPSNLPAAWTAASAGPFKIDKLNNIGLNFFSVPQWDPIVKT